MKPKPRVLLKKMILGTTLFAPADFNIFRIGETADFESDDFLNWPLEPLYGATLSEDHSLVEGVLDGYFVVKAIHITGVGQAEDCYINLTAPERISDYVFLHRDGKIIRRYIHEAEGEVIAAVGVECQGLYELFYSRKEPDIGLGVLRNALKLAKKRAPIAEDMAYILRDEDRIDEAIEAFTIVIEEGEPNEFTFSERADLYEKIGDLEKARLDHQRSQEMMFERTKRSSA